MFKDRGELALLVMVKAVGRRLGKAVQPSELSASTQVDSTFTARTGVGQSTDWTPRQPESLYNVTHTALSPFPTHLSVIILPLYLPRYFLFQPSALFS